MLELYEAVLFALLMIVVIVWAALSISYFQYLQSRKTVAVVRCKDCKWWNEPGCAISIVDESDKPHENDFCSFGERRDATDE